MGMNDGVGSFYFSIFILILNKLFLKREMPGNAKKKKDLGNAYTVAVGLQVSNQINLRHFENLNVNGEEFHI